MEPASGLTPPKEARWYLPVPSRPFGLCRGKRVGRARSLSPPQHPDEYRPHERTLLAVDQRPIEDRMGCTHPQAT